MNEKKNWIGSRGNTYIISCGDGDAVLEGVPAHVKNLLVEVNLVGVRLLPHSLALATRTVGPRVVLLPVCGSWTRRGVDGRRNSNFLSLESRLVCLKYYFRLFLGV